MTCVAAKVRAQKAARPSEFCADPRCLWRTQTRAGYKPCPKHPATALARTDSAPLDAQELER